LANENVARLHLRANANDAILVEVSQGLLGDVWNVAGELLASQLRLADLDLKILYVNAGKDVVLDEPLGDENGVLKVVAVERHERDQDISAQRQLAARARRSIGDDLIRLDLLSELHQRNLVETRPLVQAVKLTQLILFGIVEHDPRRIDVR